MGSARQLVYAEPPWRVRTRTRRRVSWAQYSCQLDVGLPRDNDRPRASLSGSNHGPFRARWGGKLRAYALLLLLSYVVGHGRVYVVRLLRVEVRGKARRIAGAARFVVASGPRLSKTD